MAYGTPCEGTVDPLDLHDRGPSRRTPLPRSPSLRHPSPQSRRGVASSPSLPGRGSGVGDPTGPTHGPPRALTDPRLPRRQRHRTASPRGAAKPSSKRHSTSSATRLPASTPPVAPPGALLEAARTAPSPHELRRAPGQPRASPPAAPKPTCPRHGRPSLPARRVIIGATEHDAVRGAPPDPSPGVPRSSPSTHHGSRGPRSARPPSRRSRRRSYASCSPTTRPAPSSPSPKPPALCHRHGALLHVDAVQAAGRIPDTSLDGPRGR